MIKKAYTNSQLESIINEHIHNQRNRQILKMRFIDGLTYEQIAEMIDLSPRYIQTIVYKNEMKIFKYL